MYIHEMRKLVNGVELGEGSSEAEVELFEPDGVEINDFDSSN